MEKCISKNICALKKAIFLLINFNSTFDRRFPHHFSFGGFDVETLYIYMLLPYLKYSHFPLRKELGKVGWSKLGASWLSKGMAYVSHMPVQMLLQIIRIKVCCMLNMWPSVNTNKDLNLCLFSQFSWCLETQKPNKLKKYYHAKWERHTHTSTFNTVLLVTELLVLHSFS